MAKKNYDLIVIGAGPAGLTAALFAKRMGLNCLVFDNPEQPSMTAWAKEIENYPGVENISGPELLKIMKKQIEKLKTEIKNEEISDIKKEGEKIMVTSVKGKYEARTIIIATGAKHRTAGIPGESEFSGKGVSYCAQCDGPLFKGKTVAVIGGGNTALMSAVYLKEIGCKVFIVHRRDKFRAEQFVVDKAAKLGIEFVFQKTVKEIKGSRFVEKIVLDDNSERECQGVFICYGEVPAVELVKKIDVKVDENNFIIADKNQLTNVEGVYAAGDVTDNPLKQIASACGTGATAAFAVYKKLKKY